MRNKELEQAWADAVSQAASNFAEVCDPNVLDKLIKWKLHVRSKEVQRTWKIEITASFADEARYAAITTAVQQAAVVINAKIAMGMDQGVKPQIAAWSDDFYGDHKNIEIWAAENPTVVEAGADAPDRPSDELLEAIRDLHGNKD